MFDFKWSDSSKNSELFSICIWSDLFAQNLSRNGKTTENDLGQSGGSQGLPKINETRGSQMKEDKVEEGLK